MVADLVSLVLASEFMGLAGGFWRLVDLES
jgi:hypothetical protein